MNNNSPPLAYTAMQTDAGKKEWMDCQLDENQIKKKNYQAPSWKIGQEWIP